MHICKLLRWNSLPPQISELKISCAKLLTIHWAICWWLIAHKWRDFVCNTQWHKSQHKWKAARSTPSHCKWAITATCHTLEITNFIFLFSSFLFLFNFFFIATSGWLPVLLQRLAAYPLRALQLATGLRLYATSLSQQIATKYATINCVAAFPKLLPSLLLWTARFCCCFSSVHTCDALRLILDSS